MTTRFSSVITAITAALAALLIAACTNGGDEKSDLPTTRALDVAQDVALVQESRTYLGTAATVAQIPDVFGTPRIVNYSIPVAIEVGPPLVAQFSGQVEDNPFHFSVNPTTAEAIGQEGLFTILSTGISFQGSPSSELLVQYWSFIQTGEQFSGELRQPQNALSLTSNLINLPQDLSGGLLVPFTFGLAQGTRLAGLMTPDQISFRVEGNTLDLTHPFISDVVANRVR
jgi:hypothetical protein